LNPETGSISRSGLYRFSRTLVGFLTKTYIPATIVGAENIPKTGGIIIASNHLSLLDVPLLGFAIGREARFPAKPELFSHPLLSRFLLALGGFPITRGEGDRKAISFSEQVLLQGGVLGIFPEGTRSRDGALHPFHRGVALLAMSAGVPIVPAAIQGSDRSFPPGALFPRPARIVISFGLPEWPDPISSDPSKKKEASLLLTKRIHEDVSRLLLRSRPGESAFRGPISE
jgi:1-acyl-sn-glycerol-3-phosphate acyltransferase